MTESPPPHDRADFLAHNEGDAVAVAVHDVEAGQQAGVAFLDSGRRSSLEVRELIPLGHKVSLAELEAGSAVVEYGQQVGLARRPIGTGELVHTHNIRSAKWQLTN